MCAECHSLERQNKALREFVESVASAKLNLHGMDARGALQTIQKQAKAAIRKK